MEGLYYLHLLYILHSISMYLPTTPTGNVSESTIQKNYTLYHCRVNTIFNPLYSKSHGKYLTLLKILYQWAVTRKYVPTMFFIQTNLLKKLFLYLT